jgi:methylmalonyl-CoA carboxyltransferase large subunit
MKPDVVDRTDLSDSLEAIRQELARLSNRVAALEAAVGEKPHAAVPPSPPTAEPEAISEEILLVISAAIAAFLGKKPHIRQIRLVGSAAWSQAGRVTIQASHALPVKHG